MKPLLIAISGGSGSGKTTVANQIIRLLNGKNVTLISLDNYYKDVKNISNEEREKINFDNPDALDWELLKTHLTYLAKNKAIQIPQYSFTEHARLKKTISLKPCKVIIFEGIFALWDKELNKNFGLRIFVDTDSDIRFIRRLKRDIAERGRNIDEVITRWTNTVKPAHEEFIEPTKRFAHIILPEQERGVSIELIKEGIKGLIKKI